MDITNIERKDRIALTNKQQRSFLVDFIGTYKHNVEVFRSHEILIKEKNILATGIP
jgi:hypothetical protein